MSKIRYEYVGDLEEGEVFPSLSNVIPGGILKPGDSFECEDVIDHPRLKPVDRVKPPAKAKED